MFEALVLSMVGLEALAVVHGLTRDSLVCTWMTDIVGRLRCFVSLWHILHTKPIPMAERRLDLVSSHGSCHQFYGILIGVRVRHVDPWNANTCELCCKKKTLG